MHTYDLADYSTQEFLDKEFSARIIVKSQNQLERRRNMLSNLKSGKIGRTTQRPVSEGLFVSTNALGHCTKEISHKTSQLVKFQEPRHLCPYRDGHLLTTINEIHHIDVSGKIIRSFSHDLFAFLHTICLDSSGTKALVVSSGYDLIVEIDLENWKVCWTWCGWDQGFNPNSMGEYCVRSLVEDRKLKKSGKTTLFVDPAKYGLYGLPTNKRTTHPNAAVYKEDGQIIATLGMQGAIIQIDQKTGHWEELLNVGAQMPHGIRRWKENWIITNTTKGEFWIMDSSFQLKEVFSFCRLPGKPAEIGEAEWVQQVVPVKNNLFLALDANRGLVFFDIASKYLFVQKIDPNWCVQDCLIE